MSLFLCVLSSRGHLYYFCLTFQGQTLNSKVNRDILTNQSVNDTEAHP